MPCRFLTDGRPVGFSPHLRRLLRSHRLVAFETLCRVLAVTNNGTDFRAPEADDAADRAVHAFALVESWLFSDAMRGLLEAVGESASTGPEENLTDSAAQDKPAWLRQTDELPEWLVRALTDRRAEVKGLADGHLDVLRRAMAVEWAAERGFDFRTRNGSGEYRERADAAAGDFDDALRARIRALADELGLVSPRPTRHRRYDKTLIMGGGYVSPLLRARYAAQIQDSGVELGELSFLGSPRFLITAPAERPVTDAYAPGATDEFDLLQAAARVEFGVTTDPAAFVCGCASADAICPNWTHGDAADGHDQDEDRAKTPPAYTHERRVAVRAHDGREVGSVYSASTSRPPLRPNTSDTFVLWARCSNPQPHQRVLVVTTQVFVPFQAFDGIRRLYLTHGMDVDTVGFGPEWGDRPDTAEYWLQETLSAIRSSRRLLVDAAEILMRAA